MKTLSLVLSFAALAASAFSAAPGFEEYQNFPTPTAGSFTVVGSNLLDGRLVIWNGDQLFRQRAVNADSFEVIASGYAGDPAFLLRSPDNESLLLGAGFSQNIYRMDIDAPEDFSPASIVMTAPHFGAAFLTEELLLIDLGRADFSGSELHILDLSGTKKGPRAVVTGLQTEKDLIIAKPPFTYSSTLFHDADEGIVYSVSAFGTPRELRYFTVAELINAYENNLTLDWTADGTLIGSAGQFTDGGAVGKTDAGFLVLAGPGEIQVVNPRLDNPSAATIVESLDPSGLGGFYSAIFNDVTDVINAYDESFTAYVPEGTLISLPVMGLLGMTLLSSGLMYLGRKR